MSARGSVVGLTLALALALALAVAVLLVSVSMAAVGAWHRGDGLLSRFLLAGLASLIVVAAHVLPGLVKSWLVWPAWVLCFLVAVYGHAGFFGFAGFGAQQERAKVSIYAQAQEKRRQAVLEALEGIKARPVAVVAGKLAREQVQAKREALELELSEAKKAAALRDELVRLADPVEVERMGADPVIEALGRVLGVPMQSVGLLVNMGMAALLELLGALLWWQVLRNGSHGQLIAVGNGAIPPAPLPDTPISTAPETPMDRLKAAMAAGQCKPTVSSIRTFMRCSQSKAMQYRRELLAV